MEHNWFGELTSHDKVPLDIRGLMQDISANFNSSNVARQEARINKFMSSTEAMKAKVFADGEKRLVDAYRKNSEKFEQYYESGEFDKPQWKEGMKEGSFFKDFENVPRGAFQYEMMRRAVKKVLAEDYDVDEAEAEAEAEAEPEGSNASAAAGGAGGGGGFAPPSAPPAPPSSAPPPPLRRPLRLLVVVVVVNPLPLRLLRLRRLPRLLVVVAVHPRLLVVVVRLVVAVHPLRLLPLRLLVVVGSLHRLDADLVSRSSVPRKMPSSASLMCQVCPADYNSKRMWSVGGSLPVWARWSRTSFVRMLSCD